MKPAQIQNTISPQHQQQVIKEMDDLEYVDQRLKDLGKPNEVRVGIVYIKPDGEIYRVAKIEVQESEIDWTATREIYNKYKFVTKSVPGREHLRTAYDAGEVTDEDVIWIKPVKVWLSWLRQDDPEQWVDDETPKSLEAGFDKDWLRLNKPLSEYQEEAMGLKQVGIAGTDKYWDESVNFDSGTALIGRINKDVIEGVKEDLEEKSKHVAIVKASMNRRFMLMERSLMDKIELEKKKIEGKKNELSLIMDEMQLIVADFQKKIKKMQEMIAVIELYLGVHEKVIQIQDGTPASPKEVIHLFQMLLYMDEEAGDPRILKEGVPGIHSGNIQDFDRWLCEPMNDKEGINYERLIPTEKGIVALQISRQTRAYYKGEANFWANAQRNQDDRSTYILIRNGEKIYRICSNINFQPRMFPLLSEMENHYQELSGKFNSYTSEEKRDKISDEMYEKQFPYMKKALMLQGILDRTDIFKPIPAGFSFSNPDTHKGVLLFVQDDEYVLPDGMLPFGRFKDEANDKIERGSRVIVIGGFGRDITDRLDGRFGSGWKDKDVYSLPNQPKDGIYTVESMWVEETRTVYIYKQGTEGKNKGEVVLHDSMGYGKPVNTHEVWIDKDQTVIDSAIQQLEEMFKNSPRGTKDYEWYWSEYSYRHYTDDSKTYYNSESRVSKRLKIRYKTEQLLIKYNPEDEVSNDWDWRDLGHKRKNRLSFKIYRDDKAVLNYDQIDLEDIEYYINSRQERVNYMWVIRELWEMRDQRKAEIAEEKKFVEFAILHRLNDGFRGSDLRRLTMEVWKAVEWWKTKVIWKRPLTEDIGKAVRMITNKVNAWRIPYGKRNGIIK